MKMFLAAILGVLFGLSPYVFYPSKQDETDTAKLARFFLQKSENKAESKEEIKCDVSKPASVDKKKKENTKRDCKKILTPSEVVLAAKRDGDKEFVFIRTIGIGKGKCDSKTIGFTTMCHLLPNGETNGYNTEYEITSPEGYKVYAIGRKDGVYTPYSKALDTIPNRLAGRIYVNSVIKQAADELRSLGVRSLVDIDYLVSDRTPLDVIQTLAVVEHVDGARFTKKLSETLMNEVYATYGLNQRLAYRYSVSSAGARGMFQIIPPTYKGIVKKYPEAKLKSDFVEGTEDHVNAAKVAILLADHDTGLIKKEHREKLIADKQKHGEYIASSYNGGPTCVGRKSRRGLCAREMFHKFGEFVLHNPNEENRVYVSKLIAMR